MNIGLRIKLARKKARFSMKELADKVGVSTAAISKFERELTFPRQSTLIRLARALSVDVEFFFRENTVNTLAPTYRKHYKFGKKDQEALEANITEVIERYLEAMAIFDDFIQNDIKLPAYIINNLADTEKAATELRDLWNLGLNPIVDLAGTLEKKGIAIIAVEGYQKFDGISCWVNDTLPVIVFNKDLPGDRQRFSIAHELGHLVLQSSDFVDLEKAAHRFAASFLVPAPAAKEEFGNKRTNLSLDELLILKQIYGFSIQAWTRRAFDLNIISHSTYTSLCIQINSRGWRINEPVEVPSEEPNNLKLTVYKALAEKMITPSYAAKLLKEKSTKAKRKKILYEPSDDLVHLYVADPELTAFNGADLGEIDEEY